MCSKEDEDTDLDALRHNIQSKGKYSYYYGHADQDRIMKESGEAIRVAGGTPKLLKRTETPSSSVRSLNFWIFTLTQIFNELEIHSILFILYL